QSDLRMPRSRAPGPDGPRASGRLSPRVGASSRFPVHRKTPSAGLGGSAFRPLPKSSDSRRNQGSLLNPVRGPVSIQLHGVAAGNRVIVAELLQDLCARRAARIRYDDSIVGSVAGAHAAETNLDHV